jgi:hypothetical protein
MHLARKSQHVAGIEASSVQWSVSVVGYGLIASGLDSGLYGLTTHWQAFIISHALM